MRKRNVVLAAATIGVALLGAVQQAWATSYASQVTVSGSTLTFDLNESINGSTVPGASAGSVELFYNNGVTQTLPSADLTSGLHTVTLSQTPTTPVNIAVTTNDANGYLALGSATVDGISGSSDLEIDTPGDTAEPITFEYPRGVTVDSVPGSPSFGDVYVSNAGGPSTLTIGSNTAYQPAEGIYILNADMSFQGAQAGEYSNQGASASKEPTEFGAVAGLNPATTFPTGTGGTYGASPWRLSVGDDGYLYIASAGDDDASLYRAQLSATQGLVPGSGVNLLSGAGETSDVSASNGQPTLADAGENHGKIMSTPFVTGSTAAGNLTVYALDWDYGSVTNPLSGPNTSGGPGSAGGTLDYNQLYQWNVGSTTSGYGGAPVPLENATNVGLDGRYWEPQTTVPTGKTEFWFNDFYGVTDDMAQGGPANQLYVSQDRSAGGAPGLFVLDAENNSTVEWDSYDQTLRQNLPNASTAADYFINVYSVTVSPDGRFLYGGQDGGTFGGWIVPLLAGIPDVKFSTPVQTGASGASGDERQSVFDAADNIYVANSSYETLTEWGPGGTSVAVTGSNGTFTTSGAWTGTSGSNNNLSNTSNWSVGYLPNGSNLAMTFGPTTGTKSINADTSVTVGAISFTDSTGYTISGSSAINLTGFGGNLTAQAGTNTISAPMTINTDTGLYAAAGASLTISGPITYTTPAGDFTSTGISTPAMPNLVKNGRGMVAISNLNLAGADPGDASSANLDIYDGELKLLPNSGPAVVNELSIFNSTASNPNPTNASLDLTNNDLIYYYSNDSYTQTTLPATASNNNNAGDPIGVITGLVQSGGIFSSMAGLANGTGLAVAENNSTYFPGNVPNDSTFSTFDGQTVNTTSSTGGTILVKYTYYGDLNFDGQVDSADLALMGIDGTTTTMGWVAGDLNYDGVVNEDDWSLFFLGAAAYDQSQVVLGQAPEPASLGLIALAAIPMLRRRRA